PAAAAGGMTTVRRIASARTHVRLGTNCLGFIKHRLHGADWLVEGGAARSFPLLPLQYSAGWPPPYPNQQDCARIFLLYLHTDRRNSYNETIWVYLPATQCADLGTGISPGLPCAHSQAGAETSRGRGETRAG